MTRSFRLLLPLLIFAFSVTAVSAISIEPVGSDDAEPTSSPRLSQEEREQARDERQAEIEARQADMEANREERTAQVQTRLQERVQNHYERLSRRYAFYAERFQNIFDRFQSRLDYLSEQGVDTSAVQTKLIAAIDQLSVAQAAGDNVLAALNAIDTSADPTAIRDELAALRTQVEETRTEFEQVRTLLKEALTALKELSKPALPAASAAVRNSVNQ